MTQTTVPAFRVSVNPPSHPSNLARLRSLARPAEQGLLLAALLLFLAGTAQAAGSSMPWEGPLQSILESIQGPVARIVAVIIRSEEHTSELQSLMRTSYAVFCLKKKITHHVTNANLVQRILLTNHHYVDITFTNTK